MAEREQERSDEPGEPSARILVIDDEEVIHASLQRLLGRQGHQVEAVLSAKEGIAKLRSEKYDLVITDLMMPEMNGLELLEKLRELELDLPVLMITGYPTIRTAMQAMRLGAVDYLAKPFRRQELLGPVRRLLRRGTGRDPDAGTAADAAAPGPDPAQGPRPGDRYVLHDHAWAEIQQDGTARIGIEESFLGNIGPVGSIGLPQEAELLEQGYVGIRLTTSAGEEHGVFMPLSGQAVAINEAAQERPGALDADTWLVQLIPGRVETELTYLLKR